MVLFNNMPDDDELIDSIMSELESDSETAENTEEEKEETQKQTQEGEDGGEGENQEVEQEEDESDEEEAQSEEESETVESKPATKAQVNKVEGFKALRKQLKEQREKIAEQGSLIAKLKGEKTKVETEDEEDVDPLQAIADAVDKTPEEIRAAIKAKKAKEEGFTLEAYEKFEDMQKQINQINADKKNAAKLDEDKKLVDTIDKFIGKTGLSSEDEVVNFFKKAKEDYGIDFVANPNLGGMLAVWNGMDEEARKGAIEQEILLKIKKGEKVMPNNQAEEQAQQVAKKQQQKKDDADYERWAKRANGQY